MEHAVTFPLPLKERFSQTLVQHMVMVVSHGAIQPQMMQMNQNGETVCSVIFLWSDFLERFKFVSNNNLLFDRF